MAATQVWVYHTHDRVLADRFAPAPKREDFADKHPADDPPAPGKAEGKHDDQCRHEVLRPRVVLAAGGVTIVSKNGIS